MAGVRRPLFRAVAAMERASILCRDGTIGPEHLPREFAGTRTVPDEIPLPQEILPLKDAVRRFETAYIEKALKAAGGSKTGASDLLGIGRKALWEKMKK